VVDRKWLHKALDARGSSFSAITVSSTLLNNLCPEMHTFKDMKVFE